MASAAGNGAGAPIDFAPMMAAVAKHLLGSPNPRLSKAPRLRFGSKGSIEVDTDEGWFDDHEANVRGGVLELIRHKDGCDTAGAFRWLEERGLKERTLAPRSHGKFAGAVYGTGSRVGSAAERVFYDYCDEGGAVLFRVERRGKDATPPFLQHGPDGRGGFHAARGCMQGVQRVLYRLPEILAAPEDAIVFVCEGEKDADRLTAAGLVATTNPGGAGKFTPDYAGFLRGRIVVALQDNDDAGASHVASVLAALGGVAANAASLLLPGLPPKGDVSDWFAAGGSAFDLKRLAADALHRPVETFDVADLALWARVAPTPKAFYMAPFVPRDDVVIITGDGGTNKSTLALQISICSAAGKQMLGMDVAPGAALYITAEDDNRENHWRLAKIANSIGTSLDDLVGRLHVVSLRGRLNNELATFDNDGKLRPAPAYALLRATIEKTGAKLVTLDNVAHLFPGNENDRGQVTAFINLLYQLCGDLGVTVLLIAHRNKAGDSYSGSTAWLNAVRSQMLIERGEEGDPDVRRLSLGKANYARQGEDLTFRWHDFALVRDADLSPDLRERVAKVAAANAANQAFLDCLTAATKQGIHVSGNVSPSYAPSRFEGMPEAKGMKKERLALAMKRLLSIGQIEQVEVHNAGKGRARGRLQATPNATPNGFPNTLPNGTQRLTPTAPPTYAYTTYSRGAASRAAPPPATDGKPDLSRPIFPDHRRREILAPGETGDEPIPGGFDDDI